MSRTYIINWKKIGRYRDRGSMVEADSIKNLEGPLREAAERYLGEKAKTMTVTFEETTMKGELDYGLTGEFTVTS